VNPICFEYILYKVYPCVAAGELLEPCTAVMSAIEKENSDRILKQTLLGEVLQRMHHFRG